MNNKESKNQINAVKKEWNISSVKKGDQIRSKKVIKSRVPKCKVCRNHGIIAELKGHKRYCQKRFCTCEKCFLTLKQRELFAAGIKESRALKQDRDREEEKEKRNTEELEDPLPLEYNTKFTGLNYNCKMKQKFRFVSSLSESLAKMQYHPMAWLLIPIVSDFYNIILQHAIRSDENIDIFRGDIEQVLCNAQRQYENWAYYYSQPPNMRNISYEKSIYCMESFKQNALQLWSINSLTWPFNSLTTAAQPSYSENLITSPQSDNTSPRLENTSVSPRLENTSLSPKDTKMCSGNLTMPMYFGPSAAYHW